MTQEKYTTQTDFSLVTHLWLLSGFPGSSVIKNLLANAGDMGLIPGRGRSPGRGNSNPLQWDPMSRGIWWTIVLGVAKSRTQPRTQAHTHGSSHRSRVHPVIPPDVASLLSHIIPPFLITGCSLASPLPVSIFQRHISATIFVYLWGIFLGVQTKKIIPREKVEFLSSRFISTSKAQGLCLQGDWQWRHPIPSGPILHSGAWL